MRSHIRRFSVLALTLSLLAIPGATLADDPDPLGSGQTVELPEGFETAAAPTLVPGAIVGTIGFGDADSFGVELESGLSGVISALGGGVYASGGYIRAELPLPAGARLRQIDVYGWVSGATGSTGQRIDVIAYNVTDGSKGGISIFTTTGSGIVHGTYSWIGDAAMPFTNQWYLAAWDANDPSRTFIGAVYQYMLPTLSLVPIAPVRVFDSRFPAFGGIFSDDEYQLIDVKDAIDTATGEVTTVDAIPPGARAVAFNLTITQTLGNGYVIVNPGDSLAEASSNINWTTGGATLANGGVVSLGSGAFERQLTLLVGGLPGAQAQLIVDITGYYQ